MDYRDLIELMDYPSNMESGLYWIKQANNKWTYDLTKLLMENFLQSNWSFETISAIAFITYIIELDAYELHSRYKKILNDFMMNASVLHFTYNKNKLFFKNIFVFMLMTIYEI